jgi:CMP/dCMP kinase
VQRRNLVVAIDGPSGSGKSTVAREVAIALDLRYLDTGAMYRAVTWLALRRKVPLDATEELADLAEHAELRITTDPRRPAIVAEGVDVTTKVRSTTVTAAVSCVSAIPRVRAAMVSRQQEIIDTGGIVVEGRDIATTVAPDAAVKIFLTAASATRAQRRARQDGAGPTSTGVADTEAALRRRDRADASRAASPLTQAPDAIVVDSSALDIGQVVATVLDRASAVLAG